MQHKTQQNFRQQRSKHNPTDIPLWTSPTHTHTHTSTILSTNIFATTSSQRLRLCLEGGFRCIRHLHNQYYTPTHTHTPLHTTSTRNHQQKGPKDPVLSTTQLLHIIAAKPHTAAGDHQLVVHVILVSAQRAAVHRHAHVRVSIGLSASPSPPTRTTRARNHTQKRSAHQRLFTHEIQ